MRKAKVLTGIIATVGLVVLLFAACSDGNNAVFFPPAEETTEAQVPKIISASDDATISVGSEMNLSILATTDDSGRLSYQWFYADETNADSNTETEEAQSDSKTDGISSGKIESATDKTLTFFALKSGTYRFFCRVTNTLGKDSKSADSATITLTVAAAESTPTLFFATSRGIALGFAPEAAIQYQWYECTNDAGDNKMPVADATNPFFFAGPYTTPGIHYYYCSVRTQSGMNVSPIVTVAYTGLPVVRVDTENNAAIADKENWVSATISVSGAADESWNFDGVATGIRGRGNTTWGQPKKPYALKLDSKQEIMGMPKHKRWVLIANYLDNSFMRNQMAFYLSAQLGLDYTVRGEFCDLILNGDYKGLYWLGEAIKCDENRVDIDEDDDWLIEMDVYYDEAWKFKSAVKGLPYMVKNDDRMATDGAAQLAELEAKISALEKLLYPTDVGGSAPDEAYADTLDIDSWAKFWLVNEIMDNGELGHPKSCYFTFETAQNRLKAGPVWDFDWASLATRTNVRLQNTLYYDALFKSPAFTARLKEIWSDRAADIDISGEIEALRPRLRTAAALDVKRWGAHNSANSTPPRANFDAEVDFLKAALEQKRAVVATTIAGLQD